MLEDIDAVSHERSNEIEPLWKRIDAFLELGSGWCEGEGEPAAPLAAARAKQCLGRLLVDHPTIERPAVFPMPDGGVQAEWVKGEWACDIVFPPDEDVVYGSATNRGGDESHQRFPKVSLAIGSANALAEWMLDLLDREAARVH